MRSDAWTRWPLMPGDVHVPRWTLEEEIEIIARQVFGVRDGEDDLEGGAHRVEDKDRDADGDGDEKEDGVEEEHKNTSASHSHSGSRSRSSSCTLSYIDPHIDPALQPPEPPEGLSASPSPSGSDNSELFTPSVLHAITSTSRHNLTQILALLAASLPLAPPSMQNRFAPLDWPRALGLLVANELVDSRTAMTLQTRMEAIYGLHSIQTHERASLLERKRAALVALTKTSGSQESEYSFLTLGRAPKRNRRGTGKKRGPYKKNKGRGVKSTAAADSEVEKSPKSDSRSSSQSKSGSPSASDDDEDGSEEEGDGSDDEDEVDDLLASGRTAQAESDEGEDLDSS